MFFYRLKIFFLRIIGYEKPLRVALLKYLSLTFKQFRPHYETILYESCLQANKLGYEEITVLELGVAGGNGIISLESYKKKIEKICNIKINIYGFDTGEGLPEPDNKYDLPFHWKKGDFKIDKKKLENKITNFISTEIEWIPLNSVQISKNNQGQLIEFFESLEDDEDVQNIFSNAQINTI